MKYSNIISVNFFSSRVHAKIHSAALFAQIINNVKALLLGGWINKCFVVIFDFQHENSLKAMIKKCFLIPFSILYRKNISRKINFIFGK